MKRKVDLVVISDVHLGTYGCQSKEIYSYLKSIKPDTLVLNGDIIDMWQFSKRYWPKSHMKVVKQLFQLASKGTQIYYITGNHDEMLRKFNGLELGNIKIVNKLEWNCNGKTALFFHGDIFDVSIQNSKWLAKIGAMSYDSLILVNTAINYLSRKLGKGKVSLSRKIKTSVKGAVKFISNFEQTAIQMARQQGYDYVICGHIHQPTDKTIDFKNGSSIRYLNSGDWVEHCTALEYHDGKWKLHKHDLNDNNLVNAIESELLDDSMSLVDMNQKQLYQYILQEFLK
ncbi:phosphoesterase [Nonlabens sp. MIC269]|uniref:UDP-2,3-diacylglucosamine diphosphatase n=1 Tax=Nonlabens sp. MIC269 TaxID=1476901 RepID=UPI00071FF277|nr:UDP-2,3-diacylglucosamine diphosphatase [Nonlabens sp. MIC269]ALM20210.1 phosphoesterase [Nonlabens sp. MIC269]